MKKFLLFNKNLHVFIASIILYHTPVTAQAAMRLPTRLAINHIIDKQFNTISNPQDNSAYERTILTETFYPIGWSKQGLFAYYREPADEACGCYFADLIIQDMKTNRIVWQFHYDSEGNPKKPTTIQALWQENQALFQKKLAHYRIQSQHSKHGATSIQFHAGSKQYLAGVPYMLTIAHKQTCPSDATMISNFTIESVTKNTKTQTQKTQTIEQWLKPSMPHNEYRCALNAAVLGVIASPYQPLHAVVFGTLYRGYEGPPHVVILELAGKQ